jgi:hypothetical protein
MLMALPTASTATPAVSRRPLGVSPDRVGDQQRREERSDQVLVHTRVEAFQHGQDGERGGGGEHGRPAAYGDRDRQPEQRGPCHEQVVAWRVDEQQLDLHLDAQGEREQRIRGCRATSHRTPTLSRGGWPWESIRAR